MQLLRTSPLSMRYYRYLLRLCLVCGILSLPIDGISAPNDIYVVTVADAIGPAIAEFVTKTIDTANEQAAACVVIELDTPGGLVESMRTIVQAILKSDVPVVVFVSPSGARAASAGVMITLAADVAAMAPGTNIGAAHPVGAGGQEIEGAMSEKVINDMVAYVRSIAKRRDRNDTWAEKAVRKSLSITETEALEKNVIDLIARDVDDLIAKLNGYDVPDKGTLKLNPENKKIVEEDFRTKVLKTISDPNIAYILLLIGLAGLYFELSNPGAIFPGVVGGIALVLAFFSMQSLPVNYAGLLLIGLAMIFFIMEMKVTSYGLLSLAGVVSLFIGTLMMFDTDNPALRLRWQVIIPLILFVSAFFVWVAGLVFKVQIKRPQTGEGGLLGQIGVVRDPLSPHGKVFVQGELWQAKANQSLDIGTQVRVIGVNGLVLVVEPFSENT